MKHITQIMIGVTTLIFFVMINSPMQGESVFENFGLGLHAINVSDYADGDKTYSLSMQILALMTSLTVLPSLILGMTSFTRIIIVLSILRQAMGTQQTPPNQVLVAITELHPCACL